MNFRHGYCGTRIYRIYKGAKDRVTNPNNPKWARYGGRGIKMHQPWLDSAALFIQEVLKEIGEPPAGACLDRKNNSSGYFPGNLRWASPAESARNTRRCKLITWQGKTLSLPEWCQLLRLPYRRIRARIHDYGWSVEEAFTF